MTSKKEIHITGTNVKAWEQKSQEANWPWSESATERKFNGANWPVLLAPGAKRLGADNSVVKHLVYFIFTFYQFLDSNQVCHA